MSNIGSDAERFIFQQGAFGLVSDLYWDDLALVMVDTGIVCPDLPGWVILGRWECHRAGLADLSLLTHPMVSSVAGVVALDSSHATRRSQRLALHAAPANHP